jgi:hypothetical protein
VQRNLTLSRLTRARARVYEALPALVRASADVSSCTGAEVVAIGSIGGRMTNRFASGVILDSDRFQAITRVHARIIAHGRDARIVKRPLSEPSREAGREYPCAINIEALLYARIYPREYACTRNAVNKEFIVRAPSLPVQLASRDFSRDDRETGRKKRRASPRFGAPTFYFRPTWP